MSNHPSSQPILCIDLKKNRIRIHKHTLHMLGDPEYIQLLVNPDTHMIAVRKSVRQDYLAHHVRACYSDIRNSYELYSRYGGLPYLLNLPLEDETVNEYLKSV